MTGFTRKIKAKGDFARKSGNFYSSVVARALSVPACS
jgi:hypothetical protein